METATAESLPSNESTMAAFFFYFFFGHVKNVSKISGK